MIQELTPDILLSAYARGIFPMADPDGGINWYSPDPRAILPLETFHVSRTLRQRVRQERFQIRVDTSFECVMRECADRQEGTWISRDIVEAYCHLHGLGFAHSVEAWLEDKLVGGLYGVTLKGAFFGESMFHSETDASKVALVHLVERMRSRGFSLLDVQFVTPHLEQFGVTAVPRDEYLALLGKALQQDCRFVG